MLPNTLIQIQQFLQHNPRHFSAPLKDGRLNSSVNEDEIIAHIKHFPIQEPHIRQWFDFSFEENGIFYPVNIKITTTTTADNLNCKLGIYYALTGLLPDFSNEIGWRQYFEKLQQNIGKDESKDYYFLVINKRHPQDILINSLKSLTTLQANGNNLPFQCKWQDNRQMQQRSFAESKAFILGKFAESIKLRADIYFHFQRLFNEYL